MALPQTEYAVVMVALDLISQGEIPTRACAIAGTTYTRLRRFVATDPLLQEIADDAHQSGFDTLADVLLHIDDTSNGYGSTDPKVMKVMSDNIKWYLTKKDAARYGEKLVVETKITADKVIVEALSRGKQRALQSAISVVVEDVAFEVVNGNTDAPVDLSEFI